MSERGSVDLQGWFEALLHPSALIELGVLLACGVLAWALASLVAKAFEGRDSKSIMFGRRVVDGVLFPALLLCLAYLARKLLVAWVPLVLFKLAIPVLLSLLVIRLGVKVLQAAFAETPLIRLLERSISWLAWLAMVLWVSGLLPLVLEELDQISWKVGTSTLTLRNVVEGTLTAALVLIITLWISSTIEARLLRHAKGGELSLRKAFSNAARALLLFLGLLLALSAVGIDLTALSVLGGAIGVGIGLGPMRTHQKKKTGPMRTNALQQKKRGVNTDQSTCKTRNKWHSGNSNFPTLGNFRVQISIIFWKFPGKTCSSYPGADSKIRKHYRWL